jgi:hypothetical protein
LCHDHSIDDLLAAAGLAPPTQFTLVHLAEGDSTNVSTADLIARRKG